ncbi:MAG: hypothetical protein ACOH2A_12150 [Sphingobacteriaceae bacterium]
MSKTDPVALISDQLLPQFIPKDKSLDSFSFSFTIAPDQTYLVCYEKNIIEGKDIWKLTHYETVKKENFKK